MSDLHSDDLDETKRSPTRVGRYRISRLLGSGGFGDVFLGYDDQLDRQVAIKVPNERLVKESSDASEYLTEARLVAKLDHPGIVPVYDVGTCDEFPFYVVSKFINGPDLRRSTKRRRLPFDQAVDLVASVADALQHAHKHGIIHRDVKPSNILIEAETKRAYLADFGLALAEQNLVADYQYAGTPAYMSPEQARGEGHRIDGRSDIFALGAVLYELLTGKRAFRGESRTELREMVQHFDPRPLRQYDETLPREIERICAKALSKRANERYQTAYDFAEDLRAMIQSPESHTAVASAESATSHAVQSRTEQPSEHQPDSETQSDSDSHQSNVESRAPVIVPKGLHSFDEHDADFFLELLPGPRDRFGIPDQLRFWITSIESDKPDSFSVGMIYGPSGCGKSSLVKAGLIPLLSKKILPVFVEAVHGFTEKKILQTLRQAIPSLDASLNLCDAVTAIRRGLYVPAEKKVLLVIDQFEQWLHTHQSPRETNLVHALRQCDGKNIQVLLLIRSDFWMSVTRFFRELEIDLVQGRNLAAIDLFPPRHAEKLLIAYGRAMGTLPEDQELSDSQRQFIQQAVADLTQDGTVVCVRLAVYAEMMKNKAWTVQTLRQLGGIEGVGSAFLEESFGHQANPKHRLHEGGAKQVLQSLLPEPGTLISSTMKSYDELKSASGYNRDDEFMELIQVLDGDLRLIAPADPSGMQSSASVLDADVAAPSPKSQYYRLTHDYLIVALRNWLSRKQRETARGRAEIILAEHSSLWKRKPDSRFLPSVGEFAKIQFLARSNGWNDDEKRLMAAACRKHTLRLSAIATFAALLIAAGWHFTNKTQADRDNAEVKRLIDVLRVADSSRVEDYAGQLAPHWTIAEDNLKREFDSQRSGTVEKLHAAMVLAPTDVRHAEYLVEQLDQTAASRVPFVLKSLAEHSELVTKHCVALLQTDAPFDRKKLQAACGLAHCAPEHPIWQDGELCRSIANKLTRLYPSELAPLRETLQPISDRISPFLKEIFLDTHRDEVQRSLATESLVAYHSESPERLCDLLFDCDERQFAMVFESLHANREVLTQRAQEKVAEEVDSEDLTASNHHLIQQANAIIALYQLGDVKNLWPNLLDSKDPRLQSLLINGLANRGSSPNILMDRLKNENEPSLQKAIFLALGEFQRESIDPSDLDDAVSRAKFIIEETPDSGLRSSALWFARVFRGDETATQWSQDSLQKWSREHADSLDQILVATEKLRKLDPEQWIDRLSETEPLAREKQPGLVGFFPMRDVSELAPHDPARSSDNGDSSPKLALPASPANGPFGSCVEFSGKAPALAKTPKDIVIENAFACSFWIKLGTEPTYGAVISKMDSSLRGFDVWIEGDRIGLHVKSNWVGVGSDQNRLIKVLATISLADDTWHHVALSYDGSGKASGVSILIDGSKAEMDTREDDLDGPHRNDAPILIGGRPKELHFAGSVSQIQLFDRPIDATRARKLYTDSLKQLASIPPEDRTTLQKSLLIQSSFSEANVVADSIRKELARLHRNRIDWQLSDQRSWYETGQGHTMIRLEAGEFRMGSLPGESPNAEFETRHTRKLNRTYAISSTEVTVEQWQRFIDETPMDHPGRVRFSDIKSLDPRKPITGVTWFEAAEYCNWLSEKEGIPEFDRCFLPHPDHGYGPAMKIKSEFWRRTGFRLPTQAEWEFACRGGTTTPRNYGSHNHLLPKYAWHLGNTLLKEQRAAESKPVALLKPNSFGLFDMHGNAMEWCIDRHDDYPYGRSESTDEPKVGSSVGFQQRSLRGGAFFDLPIYIGSGHRYGYEPSNQLVATGFRVVQSLTLEPLTQ